MSPTFEDKERGVKLYCGDCLKILPELSGIDAVVTDPPYGIGADVGQSKRANFQHGKALAPSKDYGVSDWDSKPADASVLKRCREISKTQVIFGGNFFDLPPSRCWLVWDKLNGENDYADCELAWTNVDAPIRRIQFMWHGFLRDQPGERVHPTEKPIAVMGWSMEKAKIPQGAVILDPYMGSGTTGIACLRTGRKFIGIEIDPKYYQIAEDRIKRELAQLVLL